MNSTTTDYDIIIRNTHFIRSEYLDPGYSHKTEKGDIGIKNGIVKKISLTSLSETAPQEINGEHLHTLPGVIDSQVHFREPGLEHKEDIESGTRSAAMGGVTAVFEMPNTKPATVTAEDFKKKCELAKNRSWCHIGFFVGACSENASQLATLETLPGCVGVKIFMGSSTGNLLVAQDSVLKKVLSSGKRRVAVHCEDEDILEKNKILVESGVVHSHPKWRNVESALNATKRITEISKSTGRPLHLLHISTRDEIVFLKDNPSPLWTVEVTPQHLTLFAPECYNTWGTLAQMNPPIREKFHLEGLWEGIAQGVVNVIGSDHAPHTTLEKQQPYPQSPSGIPGVQTLLPLMLNHVYNKKLSLERLVELVSLEPARIYGFKNRGPLKEGRIADLTLVDLNKKETISKEWLQYKCGWSPFINQEVTGWPEYTLVGGQVVMARGQLQGEPQGRLAEFS